MPRGGVRECHMEAEESATWRQEGVPHGGRRDCHVEAEESAAWRQERVPRGGRRQCHVEEGECHVEAGASVTWKPERVPRGGCWGYGIIARSEPLHPPHHPPPHPAAVGSDWQRRQPPALCRIESAVSHHQDKSLFKSYTFQPSIYAELELID